MWIWTHNHIHKHTKLGFLNRSRLSKDNPLSHWIEFYSDLQASLYRELILYLSRRQSVFRTAHWLATLSLRSGQHLGKAAGYLGNVSPARSTENLCGIPGGVKGIGYKASESHLGWEVLIRQWWRPPDGKEWWGVVRWRLQGLSVMSVVWEGASLYLAFSSWNLLEGSWSGPVLRELGHGRPGGCVIWLQVERK